MKKATVIFTVILAVILLLNLGFLLYLGGTFVYYYTGGVMDLVYDVLLLMTGITLAASVIPVLISGIVRICKGNGGKADLILSGVYVLIGILFVCFGFLSELIVIFGDALIDDIRDKMIELTLINADTVTMNNGDLLERIIHFVRSIRWIVVIPPTLCMIIAPMLRTFLTKYRGLQYRVELYKPVLGVLTLILTVLGAVVDQLERPTGTVIQVLGFVMGAFAIAYMIAALAGLSKAVKTAKTREAERKARPVTQQEQDDDDLADDLLYDLPAGVNPDNI